MKTRNLKPKREVGQMKPTVALLVLAALAAVLLPAGAAMARIPEPDNIIYGGATSHGAPLAAGTITLKVAGIDSSIASTSLIPFPGGGKGYILRVPLDSVEPPAAGAARPGDQASIFINGTLAGRAVIGSRGTVQQIQIDVCLATALTYYKDADGDGYSDGTTVVACSPSSGYRLPGDLIALSGDCNDADPAVHPGATEVCNGKDDDCNGSRDECGCPSIHVSPASFDFGTVAAGSLSGAQVFRVGNGGTTALEISSVRLVGTDPADYLLVADGCSGPVVPAGSGCTVRVAFKPEAGGSRPAYLRIISSDYLASPLDVALAGSGNNDPDGDGVPNGVDNCPTVANPDQADADGDGVGDACEAPDGTIPEPAGNTGLARTGQKKPYALGDDGAVKAGVAWPQPRFTDTGDGTVTDTLTGLVWLADAGCLGKTSWSDALAAVTAVNNDAASSCGAGHTDWRLPNVNELESLINAGAERGARWLKAQGFQGVGGAFWSSTGAAGDAWFANPGSGTIDLAGAGMSLGVWPVRDLTRSPAPLGQTGQTVLAVSGDDGDLQAGVPWPEPRFEDKGDGSVRDALTGLVWANNPGPAACGASRVRAWKKALAYVDCLNTHGFLGKGDWRLPNRRELRSLVNYGRADGAAWLADQGFAEIKSGLYWTSSSVTALPAKAWAVNLKRGMVIPRDKTGLLDRLRICPVRGGLLLP